MRTRDGEEVSTLAPVVDQADVPEAGDEERPAAAEAEPVEDEVEPEAEEAEVAADSADE
jgi:hypothetical protein